MKYIIGAYASAPSLGNKDSEIESIFYDKLIQSIPEIRGLEIPFYGSEIHQFGTDFLLNIIKPDWDNVLTCIPGTMNFLAKMPEFGLASDNHLGRTQAIAMHKRANYILHKMNDLYGRKSIFTVQIHTAPSFPVKRVSSSIDSFLKSLDEILSWDWGNSKIVIEHCDSFVNNRSFEKGFFPIEDEIETLLKVRDSYNIGITVNWARSVIEGRDINTPIDHIKLLSKYNLFSGLIFSGTSNHDNLYGSWKDTHMPFSCSSNSNNSLLTEENINLTLNSFDIKKIDYLGVKLLLMPINSFDTDRRVGINMDAISVLNRTLNQ
jgi:hypothetical protein